MDEKNNWKEFSDDISSMSKKIKSNITDEALTDDLKKSLKVTKESISNNFNELFHIVENTVKDDEIKKEALNLVYKLKLEMSNFIDTTKEKVSEVVNFNISEEE
jgi:hypothetical protein